MRSTAFVLFAAPLLLAQAPALVLPIASPRAQVSQRVGLTDIEVTYHRPAVKGRKVWGGLVPFGQVWRAGADENTVVAFDTPITVGGTTLPAGRYGLHMLPKEGAWTVMFSSQSQAWGSFSYDAKEDLARVEVQPVAAEATERLAYTFDDPTEKGVTLSLRWEKLRVPIPIAVDTNQVVVASLRNQLRGMARFSPEPWNAAGGWCVRRDVNLAEAEAWIDRSLTMKESYPALRNKALLLEKKGDAKGAEAMQQKALAIATEAELNNQGYYLLGVKKVDEAIALFQQNVKLHPESWNAYDSLAEGYALKGDKAQATALYRKAYDMTKAEDQRARIQGELAKLK